MLRAGAVEPEEELKRVHSKAAILWSSGSRWSVETVDLDSPGPQEVLVRLAAAGLCHSDEHALTGDLPSPLPVIGGHEGAGVVVEVGSAVSTVAIGDHVAMSFVPACGSCPSCVRGMQNLCDRGALLPVGRALSDGGFRAHARGTGLAATFLLGTFAEHTVVHEASVIKIEPDIPLDLACLVSCGVATGWGASVNAGDVRPGETVVVIGVGGVGMNAVQGARAAGASNIVAVDPVAWKLERAEIFGATHMAASLEEACARVGDITHGQMADCAVLTTDLARSQLMSRTINLVGKRGRVVVAAIAPMLQSSVDLNLVEMTYWEKSLRGTLFGSCNPRFDIPNLLRLYSRGDLLLDELVTKRYRLDEINEGYQDMRDGNLIRGVLVMNDLVG
jgi:S-(hydroxymethyl)glutathione dehydrogenase/alcohol dehydrogenase